MTTYILREKFSWGGDFDIKDDKGETKYKIKGKILTLRDTKPIYNTNGDAVCVFKQKLCSCMATFQLFKFEPNTPDQ